MFRVFKHVPEAQIPVKAHPSDACFDITSIDDIFIPIGTTVKIDTGLSLEIPEGWKVLVRDRSSMGGKGLHVLAGVLDANYSGRVTIVLHNLSNQQDFINGRWGYVIHKGDRIAQIDYERVENVGLMEVKEMWEVVGRGTNGLGSSGV